MPAVVLTDHALERYRERVKPGLDQRAVLDDACAVLAACGEFVEEAPDWVDVIHGSQFVLVGPDIAFPVRISKSDRQTLVATTCLVRGGMSQARRDAKHKRRELIRSRRAEQRRLRSLPKAARPRMA